MKKTTSRIAAILAAGIAISMVQTASATQYVWRSAVRTGFFSNYNCWQYKDANNVYQVADASHHLTTADDFSFWLQPSAGIYYVTNDTSIAFNGGQFSFGLIDVAGNMSTKSGTHLRIGTSGTAPYLAVVNKRSGNWTIGQDLFIGRSVNNYGVLTNQSGNITASSGWIYLGGNVNAAELPNTTGTLVNVTGTISAKSMVIGGKANRTYGLLDVKGGTVTMTGWENCDGEWCGVMMAGWGGARGEIRVAKGALMELTSSGANIGLGEGANVVTIDGTLRLPYNGKLVRINKGTASTGGIHITIGKTGRLECQSVVLYNDGGTGGRRLTLDGGTFAPSGNAENPMSNFSLVISDNNGTIEVPSGKTVHTGAWVMDATATSKGRLVKTGAGTLDINNWFRPSGGLRVNAGTVQMTHTASANFDSFNYPLSISKTGTVTGGAFVMGSGGSLALEFASKTSGATMNITTSFTRNANIPISFSTESAFGFDDTYTLVKGGKIANTNNFSVASATANGVDITGSVYLAVESGNLVMKRKPYFSIKVR